MITISEERMSEEFIKHHIKGLPFNAVIHHFTAKDKGSPHDHPFKFTTHILHGGYVERVYTVEPDGTWSARSVRHEAGTAHIVEATHIHEIIELPEGECWTLIMPEEKTRESRFWKFDDNGYESRQWDEGDFD